MYDSAEYANSRLAGTIVRRLVDGRPVTVLGCYSANGGISAECAGLGPRMPGVIVTLDELDLTPVPLGWCDLVKRDASYLARIPKRSDYRQGLRSSNYTSLYGTDSRFVNNRQLRRTIEGQYLSLEGALEEAVNSRKITPFTREFAVGCLDDDVLLYYKWFGAVGDVVNNRPQLHTVYQHLQESMEEAVS